MWTILVPFVTSKTAYYKTILEPRTEAFKDAIRAYSTTEMWYYKVKGDHDDPTALQAH